MTHSVVEVPVVLQWWQAAIGLFVLLGLSPAPWIAGLALGRLQFSAPAERAADKTIAALTVAHLAQLTDLRAFHASELASAAERYAELKESRDYYRNARLEERDRAGKVTDQLAESAKATAQLSEQLLGAYEDVKTEGAGA